MAFGIGNPENSHNFQYLSQAASHNIRYPLYRLTGPQVAVRFFTQHNWLISLLPRPLKVVLVIYTGLPAHSDMTAFGSEKGSP